MPPHILRTFSVLLLLCLFVLSTLQAQTLEPDCSDPALMGRTVKPLPLIAERDVLWLKRVWRVIDLREERNQHLKYIEGKDGCRTPLIQLIIRGVKSGDFKAYHPTEGEDFSTEIPLENFKTKISDELYFTSVVKFLIKEDWYYDDERYEMNVRILGICPVIEVRDDDGQIKGDQPLFWVYYPHIRNTICQKWAFEKFNEPSIPTFDDVFLKRMFASRIYKISNVVGRKINAEALGLDATFESDKIKHDLIILREDFW